MKASLLTDEEHDHAIELLRSRIQGVIRMPLWAMEPYGSGHAVRCIKRHPFTAEPTACAILEPEIHDGTWWWHLSFSFVDRMPTWPELVEVKEWLLGSESCAVQVAPPRSKYVNINPNVLHLFTRVDMTVPLPDFRQQGGGI